LISRIHAKKRKKHHHPKKKKEKSGCGKTRETDKITTTNPRRRKSGKELFGVGKNCGFTGYR